MSKTNLLANASHFSRWNLNSWRWGGYRGWETTRLRGVINPLTRLPTGLLTSGLVIKQARRQCPDSPHVQNVSIRIIQTRRVGYFRNPIVVSVSGL